MLLFPKSDKETDVLTGNNPSRRIILSSRNVLKFLKKYVLEKFSNGPTFRLASEQEMLSRLKIQVSPF